MKKIKQLSLRYILPLLIVLLGVGIALSPSQMAPVCPLCEDGHAMTCHWTAQAEMGVGVLIALHGLVMLLMRNFGRMEGGLSVFLISLLSIAIPKFLIGGCHNPNMACHLRAFPTLYVLSTLAGFVGIALIYLSDGKREDLPVENKQDAEK